MIAWQKDGKMIPSNDKVYKVETEGGKTSLFIEGASPKDDAWYQCNAVNVAGSASNRARLVVQGKFFFPYYPLLATNFTSKLWHVELMCIKCSVIVILWVFTL